MGEPDAGVRCRRRGRLGLITLDRPSRINALDLGMIRALSRTLRQWADDATVEVVVLDGAGGRGFCAGGDLRVIHDSALADGVEAARLWREEYALDLLVARFPRPVVALMDGIVMGGGLGLSVHANRRVVTERTVVAMPEVFLGLAPDVGAADFLARVPGGFGAHLALTGTRLGAAAAIATGLADDLVPSHRLPTLVQALATKTPEDALRDVRAPSGRGFAPETRDWVDECYAADDPLEILARLAAHPEEGARAAAAAIRSASPLAVAVAVRALSEARLRPGLAPCLVRDYRMSVRFLEHPDLVAGTAAVVAGGVRPQWSPERIEEVRDEEVDRFFVPRDDDLDLTVGVAGQSRRRSGSVSA